MKGAGERGGPAQGLLGLVQRLAGVDTSGQRAQTPHVVVLLNHPIYHERILPDAPILSNRPN